MERGGGSPVKRIMRKIGGQQLYYCANGSNGVIGVAVRTNEVKVGIDSFFGESVENNVWGLCNILH